MSLVQCPECWEKVSNQARSCPFCGYPVYEKTEGTKYKNIIDRYIVETDEYEFNIMEIYIENNFNSDWTCKTIARNANMSFHEAKQIFNDFLDNFIYIDGYNRGPEVVSEYKQAKREYNKIIGVYIYNADDMKSTFNYTNKTKLGLVNFVCIIIIVFFVISFITFLLKTGFLIAIFEALFH